MGTYVYKTRCELCIEKIKTTCLRISDLIITVDCILVSMISEVYTGARKTI